MKNKGNLYLNPNMDEGTTNFFLDLFKEVGMTGENTHMVTKEEMFKTIADSNGITVEQLKNEIIESRNKEMNYNIDCDDETTN